VQIARIARESSPTGGFVKKDEHTGRWYRIKESEARDKVGHAIRKAVQRLEDTQPKLFARLRKEYSAKVAKAHSDAAREKQLRQHKVENENDYACPSRKEEPAEKAAAAPAEAHKARNKASFQHIAALSSRQNAGNLPSSPALLGHLGSTTNASTQPVILPTINQLMHGYTAEQSHLLAHSLSRSTNSSLLPGYNPLFALRLQEQRSHDELALIRALQQQEEAKIRREIEYSSQRNLPIYVPGLTLRVAAAASPLLLGAHRQLPSQLAPLGTSMTSLISSGPSQQMSELLKKQAKHEDDTKKKELQNLL
jgi:hypothetical protein